MSEELKKLREAKYHLSVAAMFLSDVSQTTKPYRRSKFLNVAYKEVSQIQYELIVLLGDADLNKKMDWSVTKMPSLQILQAMIKDNEIKSVVEG